MSSGHGVVDDEDDFGAWMTHGAKCNAEYSQSAAQPQLCCQQRIEKEETPCRFCSSCGGAWATEVGKKKSLNDIGTWFTFGEQCGSELAENFDEFSMCCQNLSTCRMCKGKCGGGLTEVGRWSSQGEWGQFDSFDDGHCQIEEDQGYSTTNGDVAFCCPSG